MHRKFTSIITKEEKWYVGHCLELGVVSQGKTIEETKKNLKEAVELYIESFGLKDLPKHKSEILFSELEVSMK